MRRWKSPWILLACLLALAAAGPGPVRADEAEDAAKAEGAVRDFEKRIEEIATELSDIRSELEQLTREIVEGETGRVMIFLRGRVSDWTDRAVVLHLDGKRVFSRPLSAAELDVLGRDLPLELLDVRLPAGEHELILVGGGDDLTAPVKMAVERAKIVSWVGTWSSGTVQWQAE